MRRELGSLISGLPQLAAPWEEEEEEEGQRERKDFDLRILEERHAVQRLLIVCRLAMVRLQ